MNKYTARKLPIHKGPAAWNEILGAFEASEPFKGSATADFVIVGAGFAGLSAARRLKQLDPNADIIVLEAAKIAEGTAGRNSGFMIDLPHELTSENYAGEENDQTIIQLNRQAIQFAREAVDEYAIDKNYFDPIGKINGAASAHAEKHNKSYADHLSGLGEPCEFLDAQQMNEVTGSNHYLSGLYTPGAVLLQPAGYIRGLATGLRKTGVDIYENSAVVEFVKQGSNWLVKCIGGEISTSKVILTVNGHLESFGVERGRLLQLFLFATMTPVLDEASLAKLGGKSRWGVTPSDPMGTTMRRIDTKLGGDRIITRTCAVLRPEMSSRESDMSRAAEVMSTKFGQRFPQLAGIKMEYVWSGHLCLSINNVSFMRELQPGVVSGCVQNGLGTTRGTLTGIGAAEVAFGYESKITNYFSSEPRPKKLPPKIISNIGANLLLRWKEWRAAAE